MNFFRIASQSKLTALVAFAATGVLVGACGSTVEGGGAGGGEETSSVSTSTVNPTGQGGQGEGGAGTGGASTSVGGSAPTSIALYGDEIPDVGGDTSVSVSVGVGAGGASSGGSGGASPSGAGGAETGGTGGAPPDETSSVGAGGSGPNDYANTLFLFVSDTATACEDPFGAYEACGAPVFRAVIGLPPAYQAPGVYALNDPAINATFSESEGDGQVCSGGGGSFFDGTVEVLSIDASQVRIRLAGTSPPDLEGDHTVVRCSAEPPPQASSALAYYASDVPPPESGSVVSTTVGGGPGTENLVINFADHGQSCSDLSGDLPGPGQRFEDFLVYLPPAYLTPGTYSLSDPALQSAYYYTEENVAATSGGGGSEPGTLTIFEVTDTYVDLQLEGSQYDFANGAGQVPRCGG